MAYITFISKNASAGLGIDRESIVIISPGEKLICRTTPVSKIKSLKGRYAISNPVTGKVFCYLTKSELLAIFPTFEEPEMVQGEVMNTQEASLIDSNIQLVRKVYVNQVSCYNYIFKNRLDSKVSVVEHAGGHINIMSDAFIEIYDGNNWTEAATVINNYLKE